MKKNRYTVYAEKKHDNLSVTIITGTCRSGKTLSSRLIGSMENVGYIDEPWLPMILPIMQDKDLINPEIAKDLLRSYTEELFNDTILLRRANFRPKDESAIWKTKSAEEIFHRLVNLQTRDDVRRYIKENDPMLVYNLAEVTPFVSFLDETFPQCKIINVIRNGFDVAFEIMKKGWFSNERLKEPLNKIVYRHCTCKENSVYYMPWWVAEGEEELFLELNEFSRGLYYWRRLFEINEVGVHKFKVSQPRRYKQIRYEDILKDPCSIVDELIAFLGVSKSKQTELVLSSIDRCRLDKRQKYPIDMIHPDELVKTKKLLSKLGYSKKILEPYEGK